MVTKGDKSLHADNRQTPYPGREQVEMVGIYTGGVGGGLEERSEGIW